MPETITLSVSPNEDPQLYMLGQLNQGLKDLGRSVDRLQEKVENFAVMQTDIAVLNHRFDAQVAQCARERQNVKDLRAPWYSAVVAAVVSGAVNGLFWLMGKAHQ